MHPDPKNGLEWLIRFARASLKLFASATLQGAASLTTGSIFTFVAILCKVNMYEVPFVFFFGMAASVWPLKVYFSPAWVMERKFKLWDRWFKKGMITKGDCKTWKRELRDWYHSQRDQLPPPANVHTDA